MLIEGRRNLSTPTYLPIYLPTYIRHQFERRRCYKQRDGNSVAPFRRYFEDRNKRHRTTRQDRIVTVGLTRKDPPSSHRFRPSLEGLARLSLNSNQVSIDCRYVGTRIRRGWPGCSPLSTLIPYKSRERGRRVCARVRCNHITYDGRRVADGTEENREKKNDEWTEGEETGETR